MKIYTRLLLDAFLVSMALIGFGTLTSFAEELPSRAQQIVTKLAELEAVEKAAFDAKIKALRVQAVPHLEQIEHEAATTGNIEAAMAVKAKIDELRGGGENPVGLDVAVVQRDESSSPSVVQENQTVKALYQKYNGEFVEILRHLTFWAPDGSILEVDEKGGKLFVSFRPSPGKGAQMHPIIKIDEKRGTVFYQRPTDTDGLGMTIHVDNLNRAHPMARLAYPKNPKGGQEMEIKVRSPGPTLDGGSN